MNENIPVQIVIIHDDIELYSPITVALSMQYGDANVKLFKHSKDGLDYVLQHLGEKMVVLLDINFYDGREMSGLEVFQQIREQTSLVYVILITVSKITEIGDEEIKMLINKDLFKFESFTSDYTKIVKLVEEAVLSLSTRVDAVIEDWIMRHPKERRELPMLKTKDGKVYSMVDILHNIRQQTPMGIEFEKNLLKLTIELFSRQKLNLDD